MTSERTKRRRVKEELESIFEIDVNDFNLPKKNQYELKAETDGHNVICNKPRHEYFCSPKLTTANYLTDNNCFNSELLFPKVIHSSILSIVLIILFLISYYLLQSHF